MRAPLTNRPYHCHYHPNHLKPPFQPPICFPHNDFHPVHNKAPSAKPNKRSILKKPPSHHSDPQPFPTSILKKPHSQSSTSPPSSKHSHPQTKKVSFYDSKNCNEPSKPTSKFTDDHNNIMSDIDPKNTQALIDEIFRLRVDLLEYKGNYKYVRLLEEVEWLREIIGESLRFQAKLRNRINVLSDQIIASNHDFPSEDEYEAHCKENTLHSQCVSVQATTIVDLTTMSQPAQRCSFATHPPHGHHISYHEADASSDSNLNLNLNLTAPSYPPGNASNHCFPKIHNVSHPVDFPPLSSTHTNTSPPPLLATNHDSTSPLNHNPMHLHPHTALESNPLHPKPTNPSNQPN